MAASNNAVPMHRAELGRRSGGLGRATFIAMRSSLAALGLAVGVSFGPACWADSPVTPYEGQWVLQVGGHDLFVLRLAAGSGTQPIVGLLMRPKTFSLSGQVVSQIRLPVIRENVVRARLTDASLLFTVQDASDPKNADDFELKLLGSDAGELSFAIAPTAPLSVRRVGGDAEVATDWNPETTYGPEEVRDSNPEMARVFAEDQADRQDARRIDWSKVTPADAERRREVRSLLAAGALHTGTDFMGAAFVFQHGDKPDDFLLAHVLAMIAMKKGRTDADWIAAATLDRYLQRIDRPQIFGTQFSLKAGRTQTQEPFDRDLVLDALRSEMNVPSPGSQPRAGAEP